MEFLARFYYKIVRRNLDPVRLNAFDETVVLDNVVDFCQLKRKKEREAIFFAACADIVLEEHLIEGLEGFVRADAERILLIRKKALKRQYPEFFPATNYKVGPIN